MNKVYLALALVCVAALMVSCVAGPNELVRTEDSEGKVAGFWRGLWHGIISPLTFIISLFAKNVHFYEVHNNGNWYNLGFVLGAGLLGGGGILGGRRKHRDD